MSLVYIRSKFLNNFPKEFQLDREFNQEHFDYFMSNMDLQNAAEYAAQFRFTGSDSDLELENRRMINNLKREAATIDYRTKNMTQEQRDAFSFNYAIEHNLSLPTVNSNNKKNTYVEQYRKYINDLGGKGSTSLQFNIKNNDNTAWLKFGEFDGTTSDNFFNLLGIGSNPLNGLISLGAKNVKQTNDGYSFTIDKSNPDILKFISVYGNSKLNSDNMSITGFDAKGNQVNRNELFVRGGGHGVGYTSNSVHVSASEQDYNTCGYITGLVNTAKELSNFESMDAQQRKDQSTQREMILTGYMSPAHQLLVEDFNKGIISPQYYEKALKNLENTIPNLIETAFTQNEVYYNDDKDQVLRFADNDLRQALENEFRAARNIDKGVSWQAAIVGGRLGVYITLPPRINPKDWKDNGYANPDPSASKSRHIFIPDVFQGTAEDMYYRNPKTRAAQEIEEMDINKYDYEISDNRKLIPTNDGNYILRQTKLLAQGATGWEDTIVDKFHAQQLIAEEMSYQDTADDIKALVADSDGNLDMSLVGAAISKLSNDIKASVMNLWPTEDETLVNQYCDSYIENVCKILGIDINTVIQQLVNN